MSTGACQTFRLIESGTVYDLAGLRNELETLLSTQPADSPAVLASRGPSVRPVILGLLALMEKGLGCALVRDPTAMPDGWTAPEADRIQWVAGLPASIGPGLWMQTSGTSGRPKWITQATGDLLRHVRPGQRPAVWLLSYEPASFAGVQVLLSALHGGHDLVCPAPGSPLPQIAALATRYGVTHLSGTPTFWRAFMRATPDTALALEHITLGGEVADQATLDALRQRFPQARIRHIYASTEAGVVFSVQDGRAGFPEEWLQRPLDNGMGLAMSDRGTLMVGPHAAPRSRWIDTGDAIACEGGRASFRGRVDAMVNVGGVKVFPEEIEGHLMRLPFLNEALVHAKPNPITGSILIADVVVRPGTGEDAWVLDQVRGHLQSLSRHARPALIRIRSAVDRGATQKKART